jgi:choline transporter-like protein 2/4/5
MSGVGFREPSERHSERKDHRRDTFKRALSVRTPGVDDLTDVDNWKCTDVLFLIVFALMWVGLLVIFFVSFVNGDLAALEYGTDYLGNRCGTGNLTDRPVVWYPRISEDLGSQWEFLQSHPSSMVMYGVCLPECPTRPSPPIADYGWFEGHPSAKAAYWPVAMSTFNAINHCIPEMKTNSSVRHFCEFPDCKSAGESCKQVVGVSGDVWELTTREQYSKCSRQVDLVQQTYTKQPNTGPVLEYLLAVASELNAATRMVRKHALEIFAYGVGLSTLLGFGWMVFLFLCAGVAVYLALLLLGLLLTLCTLLFAYKGGVGGQIVHAFVEEVLNGTVTNIQSGLSNTVASGVVQSGVLEASVEVAFSQAEDMRGVYQGLAIVSAILLFLFIVLLCSATGQIGRTVALVKEATLVVHNSKAMVFFPLVTSAMQLLLIAFGVFTLAFLHTNPAASYQSQLQALQDSYSNTVEATSALVAANASSLPGSDWVGALQSLDADQVLFYENVYLIFGMIWTYHFIAAIGTTTISGCVVYFFFIDEDTAGHVNEQFQDNQTDYVVTTMFLYVLRYNLGSMAFGSLILAIVEALVLVLEFLDAQTKTGKEQNAVIKIIMRCCKCCLFCFERCIKFVSSYAYIFVFMQNTGFCTACYKTWKMMSSYPMQLSINKIVQRVLFAMQSMTVPLVCTAWAYASFLNSTAETSQYLTTDTVIGAMVPASLVFVLSLVMARSFASVYEQVVNALTACVLQDITQYKARYARSQLREAFDLPPKKISLDDDDDDDKKVPMASMSKKVAHHHTAKGKYAPA